MTLAEVVRIKGRHLCSYNPTAWGPGTLMPPMPPPLSAKVTTAAFSPSDELANRCSGFIIHIFKYICVYIYIKYYSINVKIGSGEQT